MEEPARKRMSEKFGLSRRNPWEQRPQPIKGFLNLGLADQPFFRRLRRASITCRKKALAISSSLRRIRTRVARSNERYTQIFGDVAVNIGLYEGRSALYKSFIRPNRGLRFFWGPKMRKKLDDNRYSNQ
jgi:hypothetical protein